MFVSDARFLDAVTNFGVRIPREQGDCYLADLALSPYFSLRRYLIALWMMLVLSGLSLVPIPAAVYSRRVDGCVRCRGGILVLFLGRRAVVRSLTHSGALLGRFLCLSRSPGQSGDIWSSCLVVICRRACDSAGAVHDIVSTNSGRATGLLSQGTNVLPRLPHAFPVIFSLAVMRGGAER